MVHATKTHHLSIQEFAELCENAVAATGANRETVTSLTRATLAAEQRRKPAVGAAHLLDYLAGLREGRINPAPNIRIEHRFTSAITADADEGIAQVAFDAALDQLSDAAASAGIAALSVRNAFSGGEIGYYAGRLAQLGFVALACGNSAALMASHGSRTAITGTNPLAFALPHENGPRMFDQAASATAWVKVRDAAQAGEPLPEGWAIDAAGDATTDAHAAMSGALLPFGDAHGGVKGGNIALMIEMLAALSGGQFSLDAAPFDSGTQSPKLGVFVLVINPSAFDEGFVGRSTAHLDRLEHEHGVHFARRKSVPETIELSDEFYVALSRAEN